jgi:hypothetical protein
MTPAEQEHLRRRAMERDEVRSAIARSTSAESISRRLGDDLIDACRELVGAWHERRNNERRMRQAVIRIEDLVGRP